MLTIKNLTKTYDNRSFAIKDLSFSLAEGQTLALLGHNGAGKSTTLKMIASILAPTRGEVEIHNVPILNAKDSRLGEIKRKIGFLPESPFLIDPFTPAEYLFYIGKLYGIADDSHLEKTINHLTGMLDIDEPAEKFIQDYSSGLKKRIAIASVLINNPRLLLLDEPTNNLDPVGVKLLREYLQKLKKEGTAILLATHRLDFAEQISDNIIVIEGGQTKFHGNITELESQLDTPVGSSSLEDLYTMLANR